MWSGVNVVRHLLSGLLGSHLLAGVRQPPTPHMGLGPPPFDEGGLEGGLQAPLEGGLKGRTLEGGLKGRLKRGLRGGGGSEGSKA